MADDLPTTGAFEINGQRATEIRYEATSDQHGIRQVELRFLNGDVELTRASLSAAEASHLLGDRNYGRMVHASGAVANAPAEKKKSRTTTGALKGASLSYRQASEPKAVQAENVIESEGLVRGAGGPPQDRTKGIGDPMHTHAAGTPVPAAGAPENVGPPADSQADSTAARHSAVPRSVADRFLKVENRYYFPDRTLAFTDDGTRLKASTHNTEVIRSLIEIAEARGWAALRVTGTPQFRAQVWQAASQRGIDVRGYDPSDVEREALRRAIDKRRDPPASGPAPNRWAAESGRAADGGETTAEDRADRHHTQLRGRLVDAGAAPYRFDPTAGLSYFVRLQTADGERTLWGVDLERALAESKTGVQVGDDVAVESRGSQPVTLKVPKRDNTGRAIGHQLITTHRNAWLIEKPTYFDERAEQAAVFRNASTRRHDLATQRPDLVNAVVAQWLGERFAAARIESEGDRERFTTLVRDRLAQALATGEPVGAPMLRPEAASRLGISTPDEKPVRRSRSARTPAAPKRERENEMSPHARA